MALSWDDPRVAEIFRMARECPGGAAVWEIGLCMRPEVPLRTVQRILRGLVAAGFLRTRGAGPTRRYCIVAQRRAAASVEPPKSAVSPGVTTAAKVTANAAAPASSPAARPFGASGVRISSTGRVILAPDLPPPEPVPRIAPPPRPAISPRQREKFKAYLEQLVPIIVQQMMKRNDGLAYARLAAESLGRDYDEFMAAITAELDALDGATCVVYGLDPSSLQKWKRRWV